jgi:phytoene synthase
VDGVTTTGVEETAMAMLGRIDANTFEAGGDDVAAVISASKSASVARRLRRASMPFFFWSTRLLPASRRSALRALFEFCDEVGQVARSDATPTLKLALLADWRAELGLLYGGRSRYSATCALREAVEGFDLGCDEFLAVIRGAEMDVPGMRAPSLEQLDLYCEETTVAVGRLALRILGAGRRDGERIAAALGRGMQFVSILRDLTCDADRYQRLYLPRELLQAHGVFATTPSYVLARPALLQICNALAAQAAAHFAEADHVLAGAPRLVRLATTAMLAAYCELLNTLLARGWTRLGERVRVPGWSQKPLQAGDVLTLRQPTCRPFISSGCPPLLSGASAVHARSDSSGRSIVRARDRVSEVAPRSAHMEFTK